MTNMRYASYLIYFWSKNDNYRVSQKTEFSGYAGRDGCDGPM